MTTRSGAAALTLLGFACMGFGQRPTLLVAQVNLSGPDANLNLDAVMADELDRIGQVNPVIWSITDPVVRGMDSDGQINFSPIKNEREALVAAKIVGARYLLIIAAWKTGGEVVPYARLWRPGNARPLWTYNDRDWEGDKPTDVAKTTDPWKKFSVEVNGHADFDSTARSIARSWAETLMVGPLKGLPRNPRPDRMDSAGLAAPGLQIPVLGTLDLLAEVARLAAPLREAALRDAIDRTPERMELRMALFDEQVRNLEYESASETADLAAKLATGDKLWRLRSAYAYALAGQTERASALITVVEPSKLSPVQSAMLGDVFLASGDYPSSVNAYSQSIKINPSPEAVVGRAVAYGLLGQKAECEADLKSVADAPGARALAAYRLAVAKLDQAADRLGASLRDLIPVARANPGAPETISRAVALATRADALSTLVSNLKAPEVHKRSHNLLSLACNLLSQSSQEVLDLAQTGSADREGEASDSLNEALLQLPDQRGIFHDEMVTGGQTF